MLEVEGDFFTYAEENCVDVLVCTVNQVVKKDGKLVMGAGIAKAFRDRYEGLDLEFGTMTKFKKSGILVSWWGPVVLVGFPTKYEWTDPSDKKLIKKSLAELEDLVDYYSFGSILMTRPGCGNGGFKWAEIKPIMKHLDDRYIVIEKAK